MSGDENQDVELDSVDLVQRVAESIEQSPVQVTRARLGFGVIKAFDPDGHLVDAAPYFGGGSDLRLGKAEKSYVLARLVFVGPDGRQREIWMARVVEDLGPLKIPFAQYAQP